jgi:hypothetical protein
MIPNTRAIRCIALAGVAYSTMTIMASAAGVQTDLWYRSSITSDANGPLRLRAELNYKNVGWRLAVNNSTLAGRKIQVLVDGHPIGSLQSGCV